MCFHFNLHNLYGIKIIKYILEVNEEHFKTQKSHKKRVKKGKRVQQSLIEIFQLTRPETARISSDASTDQPLTFKLKLKKKQTTVIHFESA
jgi:hypothetical protein